MKVAVVFLFSLVAISTQQQLMWLVPYVSPHSYYNSHMMRENHYDPSESDPPSLVLLNKNKNRRGILLLRRSFIQRN